MLFLQAFDKLSQVLNRLNVKARRRAPVAEVRRFVGGSDGPIWSRAWTTPGPPSDEGRLTAFIISEQNEEGMVEPSGIEPLTSCMPCKRSPS